MGRQELGKRIYDTGNLNGTFILRSGQTSDTYFDKYRIESDPRLLRSIIPYFATLIPRGAEVFAGLETGGIPLATALSLYTDIPQVIVRKTPKEYGTMQLVEGMDVAGKNVCIVEDVVTTGGQVIESAQKLREMDANVEYVICLIERNGEARQRLLDSKLWLNSLFTQEQLEIYGKQR